MKILPVILSILFLISFSLLFHCCYTLKQGGIMISYLHSAVPLDSILTKEPASEDDKIFVDNVNNIRRFAQEELGLKKTKNYTNYVEIERDYLAAIVSASDKYSFKRYEWQFPIVGSVPYKGFFEIEEARSEAAKLSKKNLDVWIRKTDAFSTLGFFKDPLYSYMKDYTINELASLIIHESLHATVFVKGNMNFNEELAEIVGSEGALRYIKKLYGEDSKELADIFAHEADSKAFVSCVQDLISLLQAVYNLDIPNEEKLKQKEITIKNYQESFLENYDANFKTDNYKGFANMKINNAYLELYRLYYQKDSELKKLYKENGSDLIKFIAAAKTIKGTKAPLAQMKAGMMSF
ncbi:MAG: hypothetical protein Ta2B_07440 [Termitinemataceae bacterium]|nr:MAG: hypothetical protein Ta2B_07440 [Termitinemataceae bacterium]